MELLVKAQQVHLTHPAGPHQTVLQSQLVQVRGLVGHGQLLLLHLPVVDQLLDEHHQLDRNKHRGRSKTTTPLESSNYIGFVFMDTDIREEKKSFFSDILADIFPP